MSYDTVKANSRRNISLHVKLKLTKQSRKLLDKKYNTFEVLPMRCNKNSYSVLVRSIKL